MRRVGITCVAGARGGWNSVFNRVGVLWSLRFKNHFFILYHYRYCVWCGLTACLAVALWGCLAVVLCYCDLRSQGKTLFWMLFPLLSYLVRFKAKYFSKEGYCIVLLLLCLHGVV